MLVMHERLSNSELRAAATVQPRRRKPESHHFLPTQAVRFRRLRGRSALLNCVRRVRCGEIQRAIRRLDAAPAHLLLGLDHHLAARAVPITDHCQLRNGALVAEPFNLARLETLRHSLSLRDVEELLAERGLEADHTTIWRWVQRYGPKLQQRLRRHLKPTNKSWRVDKTYIRVQGAWCYLYRAIDSTGATIDFLLSALRDAAAGKRLFRQALSDPSHPQPRIINTDQAGLYSAAIAAVKAEGTLRRRRRHRPVQYLNNILEQDHRAIKRRVKAKQSFREFHAARRTIAGYEAMHMIRKGQAWWVSDDDARQQNRFIDQLFDLAA